MNGRRWLQALLESLRNDGYTDKLVCLVDNGSTDGSQELVREQFPEVTIIQMPRNLGYCIAYNIASRFAFEAGCDWVIWQNNDTRVEKRWLHRLAEAAASDPTIGIMGPVFRDWSTDAPNRFMTSRHPEVVPFMEDASHSPVDTDWVEGSACCVSRECFNDVGPLEPDLFIFWEEADFCRRARFRSWRVVLVPGAIARHFGGGDTASGVIPSVNFNGLKTHNYYVFALCDPNRSFWRNTMAAGRLGLTLVRGALRRSRPLGEVWKEISVAAQVVSEIPKWRKKWKRDRAGILPQAVPEGATDCTPSIFGPGGEPTAERCDARG